MNIIFKIKRAMQQDEILETLKKTKYYLLSENEKRLLAIYFKDKRLIKYKNAAIKSFIDRIKTMEEEQQNYYFRNLQEIIPFEKGTLKIQKGIIDNIDYKMPLETTELRRKPSGYSKDAYFNEMIEKGNYEELFNLYGLEQIDKESDLLKRGKIK